MRAAGYYWLYRRGGWIIGEWRGEAWFVCGDSHRFEDDDAWDRIGPPVEAQRAARD
jgi:hypothetical protein